MFLLLSLTHKSQSTAIMNDKCSVGKPIVDKMINIVTSEALGTLATPIDVAVEMRQTVTSWPMPKSTPFN